MHDSALRRALGYRRFGASPRVLLFDSGYLVVADVANALEDRGWALHRLATLDVGRAARSSCGRCSRRSSRTGRTTC